MFVSDIGMDNQLDVICNRPPYLNAEYTSLPRPLVWLGQPAAHRQTTGRQQTDANDLYWRPPDAWPPAAARLTGQPRPAAH